MEISVALLFFLIFIFVFILVVRIPIIIAKNRGITGTDLTTITVLSWLGILFGLTWVVALILALLYTPSTDTETHENVNANELAKAYDLKEKGVISQHEFNEYKKKFLSKDK